VTAAAVLLGALVAAAAPPEERGTTQQISVEVRGPLVLVEVTRPLGELVTSGERLLDVALPEHAALVDVQVRTTGPWRALATKPLAAAVAAYEAGVRSRGFVPTKEPFEDDADLRLRAARPMGDLKAPVEVRYRCSALARFVNGRRRLRFPAAPQRLPLPSDVRVSAPGALDVEIAGVPARGGAPVRVPARGAWEISWSVRAPARLDHPTLTAEEVVAPAEGGATLGAWALEAHGARPLEPPNNVLFVIDRSRSVGLAGASAERDLARRLLDVLPPATRFDAIFFEQATTLLFPMSRPATLEALEALDAEMVPDRLRNGTNLLGALKAAGELLRRDPASFGPRTMLALVTDGALPGHLSAAELEAALGKVPGVDVSVAAFAVRPADDDPAPVEAVDVLRDLAARTGGVARAVRSNEIAAGVQDALSALAAGGDVALRDPKTGAFRSSLAPGEASTGVRLVEAGAAKAVVVGAAGTTKLTVAPRATRVDAAWLRPLVERAADARVLAARDLVALVEPIAPAPAPEPQPVARGALDRDVVRNTLALAFLPRARACYLNRSGATAFERDLHGRVRLAFELARGEVSRATVQDTTLASPTIEACLRQGALELEVPRPLRSDFPVTAVLNLVFRPRTAEKRASPEEERLGAQIDLVIEDLHKTQPPAPADSTPQHDRSMVPTR
jgi:hypothetical protein